MAEGENKEAEAAPAKKGGKGKLVVILLAPALLAGAGVAGAMFGPKLVGKGDIAPEPVTSAAAGPDVPLGITVEMKPIVVDLRDRESGVHHLKVTLAVELAAQTLQEEFDKLQPRAREAAIAYLRTKDFESVTDPKAFDALRKDLAATITDTVGKQKVGRVLVVDFVAQ